MRTGQYIIYSELNHQFNHLTIKSLKFLQSYFMPSGLEKEYNVDGDKHFDYNFFYDHEVSLLKGFGQWIKNGNPFCFIAFLPIITS